MTTQPAPENLLLGLSVAQWAILGSILVFILTVRRWRMNVVKKQREKSNFVPTDTRQIAGSSGGGTSMRDVTTQVQALLTEVEDTARRAAAQIDNRYRKLEQLLAEADRKIAQLEALRGDLGQSSQGQEAEALAGQLREATRGSLANREPANATSDPVYALADAGLGAKEIAQRLGKQPGEVELILALRGGAKRS